MAERNGMNMLGNDLLIYRMAREHHNRLILEGERQRLARGAGKREGEAYRFPRVRLGTSLVTLGSRLKAIYFYRVRFR